MPSAVFFLKIWSLATPRIICICIFKQSDRDIWFTKAHGPICFFSGGGGRI